MKKTSNLLIITEEQVLYLILLIVNNFTIDFIDQRTMAMCVYVEMLFTGRSTPTHAYVHEHGIFFS